MEFKEGGMEAEQSREEVERLLKEALEKKLVFDATIENSDGPSLTPDCLVEEIQGNDVVFTYIAEDGDLGESIPVQLERIKKIELKGPFEQPK